MKVIVSENMAEWYEYGLAGLFVVCFVASTLYPLGSEAFVLGFVALDFDPGQVLVVASIGNILGSLSTYYLAYFGGYRLVERFSPQALSRIESLRSRIHKYGFFYACFVFLPFLGDVFAMALGLVRYSQVLSILGIALGKILRYFVLIAPFVL